jgi:hypothetical protein
VPPVALSGDYSGAQNARTVCEHARVSQLAEFFRLRRDQLPELVEAAQPKRKLFGRAKHEFPETLARVGRELDRYGWSGYYFAVLDAYLHEEKGVALMESECSAEAAALSQARVTTWVFTPSHKVHLDAIDPQSHNEDALRRYFEEFNEYEDPDAGHALLDALAALHRQISSLDDESIVLLMVG